MKLIIKIAVFLILTTMINLVGGVAQRVKDVEIGAAASVAQATRSSSAVYELEATQNPATNELIQYGKALAVLMLLVILFKSEYTKIKRSMSTTKKEEESNAKV